MTELKILVEAMKTQRDEGKKDRYIEITQAILKKSEDILLETDRFLYVEALIETLENMDFQIYEYYRSLQDELVRQINILAEHEENLVKPEFKEIILKADAKKFLLAENYKSAEATELLDEGLLEGSQKIELEVLKYDARFAVLQINDGGKYNTLQPYKIYLNGAYVLTTEKVVTTLFDLKPATSYNIVVVSENGDFSGDAAIVTDFEYVTINVKDLGAKGDGINDDTRFIQAAFMACPDFSRVLIPEGTYLITSLFLTSNLRVELAKGARFLAKTDREEFVRFPAMLPSAGQNVEYNLGTWEGNPLPMFAGIISAINVENVIIYGQGIIDGNASTENWWKNPKEMNIAYRPRLFFTNNCKNISLVGITGMNSPSWTLHPYFSDNLGFYDLFLNNPAISPNTDGCDPESCSNVEIAGVRFTLGDDCIAVKSGKIYMGRRTKKPSENIYIHNCLMENGHGAVTLGSEMAGGVKNLTVENCVFSHTDRGLRIKTRRGRGKDAIIDGITFRNIDMDNVMTPFVANSFYFCDPDGKTDYVQSRDLYPVDERTPEIKRMVFENINARECHVAATYFEGLPEKKIEEIIMRNIHIDYSDKPTPDYPVLSNGVNMSTRRGLVAKNIKRLVLDQVEILGAEGETFEITDVDVCERL